MSGLFGKIGNLFRAGASPSPGPTARRVYTPRKPDIAAHPDVTPVLSLLHQGQFGRLDEYLAMLPEDRRFRALDRAIETLTPAFQPTLELWTRQSDTPESLYALGLWFYLAGVAAHDDATAQGIPMESCEPLFKHMHQANQIFADVQDRLPHTSFPAFMQLQVAQYLELPGNQLQARFNAVSRIDPLHYRAHLVMLAQSGNSDAMFDFARRSAAAAPDGAGICALPAEAHFETWLLLRDIQSSDTAEYFQTDSTSQEVTTAWHRSAGSPHHVEDEDSIALYNLFAGVFLLAKDKANMRRALECMQGVYLENPWAHLARSRAEREDTSRLVKRAAQYAGLPVDLSS